MVWLPNAAMPTSKPDQSTNRSRNLRLKLPVWWYIAPAYLTLWTICFSLWNLFGCKGMMAAFGVDTGGAIDDTVPCAERYCDFGASAAGLMGPDPSSIGP